MPSRCLTLVTAALLAGCSGDLGLTTSSGDTSGELAGEDGAIGLATSPYVVLDIASGQLTAHREAPALDGSAIRQDQILFRRIDQRFLIGVFEVTQAQWQALGGGTPWTTIPSTIVGAAAVAPERPAFALSYDEITATLDSYRSSTGIQIGFPSGAEWRQASDAGSGPYHWGSSEERSVVASHARTADSADGVLGPVRVGSGQANGLGLFDIHGNVWEWTDSGTILRGGSWRDPSYAGRAGYAVDGSAGGLHDDTGHPLVGLRLVLRP